MMTSASASPTESPASPSPAEQQHEEDGEQYQTIVLDPAPTSFSSSSSRDENNNNHNQTAPSLPENQYAYEALPTTTHSNSNHPNKDKENAIHTNSASTKTEDQAHQEHRRFGQDVPPNNNNTYTYATNGPLSTRHGTQTTTESHNSNDANRGWVENMVKVAAACNSLVQKNYCNMCHVYTNRQVEFEERQQFQEQYRQGDQQSQCMQQQQQQQHAGTAYQASPQSHVYEYFVGGESTTHGGGLAGVAASSPSARVWQTMNTGLEVDIYRQFLFDEASVGGGLEEDEAVNDGMNLLDAAMETAAAAVAGVTNNMNIHYAAGSTQAPNRKPPVRAVAQPVYPVQQESSISNATAATVATTVSTTASLSRP